VTGSRPYASLLARGEDRKQRILAVAQRMLTRKGWRNTTLGEIAREAGVTPAGLLHHFESKEQLLHAVLDARDAYDQEGVDPAGDVIEQLERMAARFREAPELIGTFAVLRMENLDPGSLLHDRFLKRYQISVELTAECIRRGQRAGRYRPDVDPAVKALEIVAFLNGIETSWLLAPSFPLHEVFQEYIRGLARQLFRPPETP
jgi:AcrR family transcriptional regulator